ncbi:MAG: adenylate kinase [Deltaproteobacteria bacterium]|nr:adenylate kinase [Deltaproteobacteria bacterium]
MKIIFLGPPAVGKGTHAGKIANHYKIAKISTGEMFREEAKAGTELGNKLNEYMEKGVLVPDEMVIEVLEIKLKEDKYKPGFILDGFPRTAGQAEALDKAIPMDLVVNMSAAHETIIARISNRLTCKNCQEIFNTLFIKPKVEGKCDKCGGELYQRDDQKPEVVEERLSVYERETAPLIGHYREKGILIDVSAEGDVKVVHERVLAAIEEYFSKKTTTQ